MSHPYGIGLDKNAANFVALSPLSFLERSAGIYPEHLAVVHGARRFSWQQTYARCRQLASSLTAAGVGKNDTVAVLLANTPEMVECHFGVPMTGAVLNAINTRLDAETVAFILNHGEAKVLITDREFSPVVRAALHRVERPILVIDVCDSEFLGEGERIGTREYEEFIAAGDAGFVWQLPEDEWDAIALNYTSGTTGNPKGVVVHHRGAYLGALSNLISWGMPPQSVYLWTLPMFHCNGWCFPWAMAANSGTNVCLRKVDAQLIFQAIREHKVSHYCGAPIVQALLINAPAEQRAGIEQEVATLVAGAAPPVAIIEGMSQMGFDLTHVYGLTETYGPSAVCAKHDEWQELDMEEQARLNARQGVPYHCQEGISVRDPQTLLEVPRDGETMGEIMFRGNMVMKGYLKNPTATEESFAGGWDTHQFQGYSNQGQFADLAGNLSEALAAFMRDVENRMDDVLVLTLSDFGRTAAENGTSGTDHGWGNCMFAIGGAVRRASPAKPRKVLTTWPGLAPDQLHENRDLKHTTDFRDVLAEAVRIHLGNPNLAKVLPGREARAVGLLS